MNSSKIAIVTSMLFCLLILTNCSNQDTVVEAEPEVTAPSEPTAAPTEAAPSPTPPETPTAEPTAAPADTTSEAAAEVLPDNSLPLEAYLAEGMPDPAETWSGREFGQAAGVLNTLSEEQGNQALPRYQSEQSGSLFARFIADENLDAFRDPDRSNTEKFTDLVPFLEANSQILQFYIGAFFEEETGDSEIVELMGNQLRLTELSLILSDEFLAAFDPDGTNYEARQQGMAQVQEGTVTVVVGSLQSLSETQTYRLAERKKLVGYLNDTIPGMLPLLRDQDRATIAQQLNQLATTEAAADLEPALSDFTGATLEMIADLDDTGSASTAAVDGDSEPFDLTTLSLPDGASLMVREANTLMYQLAEGDLDNTLDFHRAQLIDAGWQEDSDQVSYVDETNSLVYFIRDGVSLSFSILKANEILIVQLKEIDEFDLATLPRFGDAEITMSVPNSLVYETPASVDEVVAFTREALAALGWEETETDETSQQYFLTFHKDDIELSAQIGKGARTDNTVASYSLPNF